MFVTSFTTLPLFAFATSASKASTKVADGFFSQLWQDEGLWDAMVEGVLALLVFGAASVMMRKRRSPTSKKLPPQKAKVVCTHSNPQNSKKTENSRSETKSLYKASGALAAPYKMTPASFTDAIASSVRAGKAANLPQLLDTAIAQSLPGAGEASSEEVAATLLHSALRACAAARCFREAIAAYDHVADRIGEGTSGLWSVLLYVIVEARAFQRCNLVFANLCRQGKPSGHDVVNMVRCYAGKEDCEGLREMLVYLKGSGESLDTYTWNRALAACGNAECALGLADELKAADVCGEGLDGVSYNTLMKYSARAGHISNCFGLYSEMLEKGLEASEVTFGTLLEACVGAKNLDKARQVFDDLCASGLPLNVVHCTTYIKGLVSAGKLDEAASVLQEMTQSSGVMPDVVTYSTLVKGYAEAGDVTSSLKMINRMTEVGVKPDEIIYNSVLSSCTVFPLKSTVVMSTFEALVKLGLRPTTTTLSILLKGLAHSQAWDASLKILNETPQRFQIEAELRLYSQLAQACAKARAFAMVSDSFTAMLKVANRRKEKVDPVIAGRFLRSCLLGGSVEAAEGLHKMAQQAGVAIDPSVEKMLKNNLTKKQRF